MRRKGQGVRGLIRCCHVDYVDVTNGRIEQTALVGRVEEIGLLNVLVIETEACGGRPIDVPIDREGSRVSALVWAGSCANCDGERTSRRQQQAAKRTAEHLDNCKDAFPAQLNTGALPILIVHIDWHLID